MSLPNQSGMTAPPGLGMPPGLNFPNTSGSSANVNGIPPQPDLSSIGPHTSSAQLAALLANVGSGPDLNPFASQPQQQNAGFNNNFGSFGNNNFNNNNNQAPTGTCRMHQQGHCRYGATCRFAHVGPAGGGGGNSFGNQNNNNFGGNNFGRNQAFGNNQNNNNFGGMNNNFMRGGMNVQQSSLLQPQGVSNSQNDHDKLDASQVGAFNANAATFNPAQNAAANNAAPSVAAPAPLAAAAAAVGGNNALLQALLMQQQLNAASGLPPNPDLDNLIKSLAAPAVPAVTAPTQPATTASNNSNNSDANLNNEFLAAQAQLASLALGGSSSNSNNNNSRPMQNNFNGPSSMNFNQQHNTPFGNNNNNNSNNRFGNQGGFNKFGNNNNMHGHNSHFGGGNFPSAQHGVNQYRDQFNNNYLPGNAPGHVRFHSDANNRDFRREAEIFGPAHSQTTGINFDKYDDIPVEVTGNDIPGEMKAFTDFDFPDVIRQNIELCKYQKPTPIQKFALPVAFLGRDLMACAQTGSGKTAAFLLPFIAHLVINGRPAPQGGNGRNRKYMPVGLILAPTRELATQIWDESLKFVYGTSIHTVVVYGGQDIRQQFRELDRGCDIIIGTPGRLMDFLERGRISLAQISYLCLDEADRMLDMGFEPQIRNIVMQQDMSEQRQTLLFSATFPKEIQRLAGDFMFNYVFIAVGRVGSSSDFITQSVDWVPEEDKRTQLMKYLPTFKGLTLIFVERKKSADLLETYLNREGFHAASIHGDRSQHERETALAMFRNGRCPILVATDVAARGLDIPTLSNVVNFDMPTSIDDYVHRIGRTGRAGNSGNAWSFVNEKSSHLFKELYEMLHENKQVVPQWLAQVVESRGHNRQSGGGKKFGGRDYRAGGYGNHKGGRGGMAQHNLGKRFAQNNNNNNQNQMQGMMNFQQGGNQGNMFPSSSSNAGGFQGNVMRPNQPAQGNFNLAAAMTGRTFPAGPQ